MAGRCPVSGTPFGPSRPKIVPASPAHGLYGIEFRPWPGDALCLERLSALPVRKSFRHLPHMGCMGSSSAHGRAMPCVWNAFRPFPSENRSGISRTWAVWDRVPPMAGRCPVSGTPFGPSRPKIVPVSPAHGLYGLSSAHGRVKVPLPVLRGYPQSCLLRLLWMLLQNALPHTLHRLPVYMLR